MNKDQLINQLAHATGTSRKQVISALKEISSVPNLKKYIRKTS